MNLDEMVKRIRIEPDNNIIDESNLRIDYNERFKGERYLKGVLSKNPIKEDFGFDYAPKLYDKFYSLLEKSKYSLQDVISFASKQSDKNTGIFISAAINKIIKEEDEVFLYTQVPLDFLFYKFRRGYAQVNTAGNYFGVGMKKGALKAKEVGDSTFNEMEGDLGEDQMMIYMFKLNTKSTLQTIKSLSDKTKVIKP